MPSLALGLGLSKNKTAVYSGLKLDAQAVAHYDRVIADGGIIPAGLLGCNAWFVVVKAVYGVTDITTAISAGYDPHYLGAKIGAGSGTTLGQAATKLYSCSGASGDLTQATAASMPLLLVKNSSDANYYYSSGVAGNYCSTPNAVANQITGDIEIIAKIDYKDNGTFQWIITKIETGSTISYSLAVDSTNSLRADFGAVNVVSTISIGASFDGYVKMTRQSSSGDVKFYTSLDGTTYSQLGTTRTTAAGLIITGSGVVILGSITGTSLLFQGKIKRATISNSIGGTPVVDFNPSTYNAATSQTQWVSATGETWTVNVGSAVNGYKGCIVTKSIVQGDGVDDAMSSGALSLSGAKTNYLAANILNPIPFLAHYLVDAKNATETQVNLIYKDASIVRMYTNTFINFSGITHNRLQLFTGLVDSTSSLTKLNNANTATGTLTNKNITQIFLLSNQIGGINGNAIINTFVLTKLADTTPQQTAMYNALRGFDNNAY